MTKYLDNSGLERFFDNIKGLMRGPSYHQVKTYLDAHPEATTTVQDRAISTEKLGNKSVTTLKLGEKAVTTQKIADNAVTTVKLSDGAVTDAKLATQKVNQPLFSGAPTNGTPGQVLRTLGDGTTEWATVGLPSEAQTSAALSEWLEDHPDVTTTVQDNSITLGKLSPALANSIPLTRISEAEIQQIVDKFGSKGVPSPAYAYDTTADMQADLDLAANMIVHTNGFHTSGDGGAAYYTISASGTANGMDVLACANSLYATLVMDNELYVEQLGIKTGLDAMGNATILERALSLSSNICFTNKTYWFDTDSSITIPANTTINGNDCSLRFPNSDPALVLGGSNINIKNVKVYGNATSKSTTLFRFYYSASSAVRNIIFEEVKCYYANVAFSLERTWILEFRKCGCAYVNTCFTTSNSCNAITIDGGNYENNVVSFFVGDSTATIGGLHVKNCCIEGLSGPVFSFSNTSSRNHISVSDCYFENNQVGPNGKYPLYESVSEKDLLSIRNCENGYSPIVSSGYVNIDNTDAIAKVTGPCVLKLCNHEATMGYVNVLSSPIFSKYTEVVDFLSDDIVNISQGTIYGSSLHPNLLFLFRDSSNALISNRAIDFGTEELMSVLCLIRSSKSTCVPYAVDVEFTGDTPQSLGKVGIVNIQDGSSKTPTWPESVRNAYPYFDTMKRQQFTSISGTASGGIQGGYSYDVKCQYAPNSAAPFKLLKFAIAY